MPSVVARWSGACADSKKHDELSRYLKVLAEINHGYWTEHPAPIARINQVMHRAAGIAPLTGPTWREFDLPVEGRIVVNGDIIRRGFEDARESNAAVARRLRESGLPVFPAEESHGICHTTLTRCRLKGVDLTVFDPRRLYPGNDRLSFVLLSETGSPLLDNRLVEVQERGIFAAVPDSQDETADCCLDSPALHLRYMHEAFLDCLMVWIRWQFMDDLCYWRNEHWPDAVLYKGWFATVEEQRPQDACDAVFARLCDEFTIECDTWIARAERNFQDGER